MGYFSSNDSFVHRAAQLGLEDCAQVLIEGLDQGFKKYNVGTRAYGYLMIHLLLENDEDGHSRWAIDSSRPPATSRVAPSEPSCATSATCSSQPSHGMLGWFQLCQQRRVPSGESRGAA